MSAPHSNERRVAVAADRDFMANNIVISDYNPSFGSIPAKVGVENYEVNEVSSHQTPPYTVVVVQFTIGRRMKRTGQPDKIKLCGLGRLTAVGGRVGWLPSPGLHLSSWLKQGLSLPARRMDGRFQKRSLGNKVENPAVMTTTMSAVSNSAVYQQANQIPPPPASATSAGQFEHITVMTNLQQPPDVCAGIPVSSVTSGSVYTVPNVPNTGALQICPPSAITQQVQQSVPALNTTSSVGVQNRAEFSAPRVHTARGSNSRARTAVPAMIPVVIERGGNKQFANMPVGNDDGPTVRQHLQQQHRVRLQQQLALQEKMKAEKIAQGSTETVHFAASPELLQEEFMGEYSTEPSPAVDKTSPVSAAMNLPAPNQTKIAMPAPVNMPTSPSVNVPVSSSMMNVPRVPQMQRQYAPRVSAPKQRAATDHIGQVQMQDSHADQPAVSSRMHKQRTQPDNHEVAFAHATAVFNHMRSLATSTSPGANPRQARNARSSAMTATEKPTEIAPKKAPARKRSYQEVPASQVRVTMLGTQSEPAAQQILTESGRLLPIGIACPKQPRVEMTAAASGKDDLPQNGSQKQPMQFIRTSHDPLPMNILEPPVEMTGTAPGKDGLLQNVEQKQPMQFIRTNHDALPMNILETAEDSVKSGSELEQKHFVVPINNNPQAVPDAAVVTGPDPTTNDPGLNMTAGGTGLVTTHPVHPGNACPITGPLGEAVADEEDPAPDSSQYARKLHFMKRMVESLIVQNGALCDEVARLHQRNQTVTEENKVMAKRLQHYERNRIRRIQTKLKKAAAAQAAKASESQVNSSSVVAGAEGEGLPAGDVENDDSDDSEKSLSSSGGATPNISAAMSRVETPETMGRIQENMLKQTVDDFSVRDSGKCKPKSGTRRQQSSAKRVHADRKDKKVSSG